MTGKERSFNRCLDLSGLCPSRGPAAPQALLQRLSAFLPEATEKNLRSEPFASGVATVEVVPEFNVVFVLLPAEENFFAGDDGWKIDETAIDVLDLDVAGFEFAEDGFDLAEQLHPVVNEFSADVISRRQKRPDAGILFAKLIAQVVHSLEPLTNLRKKGAGLVAGVMLFVSIDHGAVES